jgi:hypothetical protein
MVRVFMGFSPVEYTGPRAAALAARLAPAAALAAETLDWRGFTGEAPPGGAQKLEAGAAPLEASSFGVAFGGAPVTSREAFLAAVAELRGQAPADRDAFFRWLFAQPGPNWRGLIEGRMSSIPDNNKPFSAQDGSPAARLGALRDGGYATMALWDLRCANLAYKSADPTDPEYWRERWETYRFSYVGARFLDGFGVAAVELYNEPDRDYACLDPPRYVDDVRVRSTAMQASWADAGARAPALAAPTTSSPAVPILTAPLLAALRRPFPDDADAPGWRLADIYSYHLYGGFSSSDDSCTAHSATCRAQRGFGHRQGYEKAYDAGGGLANWPGGFVNSELNCFTSRTANNASAAYTRTQYVMDLGETAACLGAQFASHYAADMTAGRAGPAALIAFKFTGTFEPFAASSSGAKKNGLFYASPRFPYHVTGSTKAGEALRLLLRRSADRPLWRLAAGPGSSSIDFSKSSVRMTAYAVDDERAYYVYAVNEDHFAHDVTFDLAALPGADPWGRVSVSAASPSAHGEVVGAPRFLGPARAFSYAQSPGSVYMLTVPKGPVDQADLPPEADATLSAGSPGAALGAEPTLRVGTSATSAADTYAAALRFDVGRAPGGAGRVASAVLQLHLRAGGGNAAPQVLTVLGLRADALADASATWDRTPALKPVRGGVASSTDNFVEWGGRGAASVVGHVTVPPAGEVPAEGVFLRLDVTDAVKEGTATFLVVRMFRFEFPADAPTPLPWDAPQGVAEFDSKEAGDLAMRPALLVDFGADAARAAPDSWDQGPSLPCVAAAEPIEPAEAPPVVASPPPPPPARRPPPPKLRRPPPPAARRRPPPPRRRRPPPPKAPRRRPPPPRRRRPPPPRRTG